MSDDKKPEPPAMRLVEKGATFLSGMSSGPAEDDKVVHLSFRSPHVQDDVMAFSACALCKNKTFTLTHDRAKGFPLMRCAACGCHIGRMGWAHDDDPAL